MIYKNKQTGEIIKWEDMNFGTEENPQCGICNCETEGHYRHGQLVEDTLCTYCFEEWEFCQE